MDIKIIKQCWDMSSVVQYNICHYDMFCLEYISLSMFWHKRDAQQVDRTVLITRATGWSYLQSFPNKLGESNCKQGSEVLSGRCASPRQTWHICYLKPEEYATRSDILAAWPYSWLQYHSIISINIRYPPAKSLHHLHPFAALKLIPCLNSLKRPRRTPRSPLQHSCSIVSLLILV